MGRDLRLRDLLIHAFQFPLPFLVIASVDLPSSSIFSVLGFLHNMKFRAPCDPIVSHGLSTAIKIPNTKIINNLTHFPKQNKINSVFSRKKVLVLNKPRLGLVIFTPKTS